jgi:hypothetical protein
VKHSSLKPFVEKMKKLLSNTHAQILVHGNTAKVVSLNHSKIDILKIIRWVVLEERKKGKGKKKFKILIE